MLLFLLFMLGSALCSFFGCIAQRWPLQQSLAGRSHCDICGTQLRVWQLIPIFGYLCQKGRCYFCHHKIDFIFWLSELLSGLIFVRLYFESLTLTPLIACLYWLWFLSLLFLSLMDHFYQMIYPFFLGPLLLSSLLLNDWPLFLSHLPGTVGLALIFVGLAYYTHSIGLGDVELILIIALTFGSATAILTIFFASGLCLLRFSPYLLKQRQLLKQPLAFYPYLSIGLTLAHYWPILSLTPALSLLRSIH